MAGAKVGTKFFYTIPYKTSSTIVITTIEYAAKSTDGTKGSGPERMAILKQAPAFELMPMPGLNILSH